ncbi:hypothetical protein CPB84DRAFT_1785346 [Gymnopilus junonius]|uniref:Vacuolar import and degradation protein 21 n=1 Tax=Gymnopilus junonius TaxID=109634 RepID=A0A9P5NKY5_GYMJU|nr:hypothetical protein CPB84DRAFT_1785346 [Gymnopilus junonius]
MSRSSHDLRLVESYDRLNSILARRNELLQEMFRMLQSKKDSALVQPNPEQGGPDLRAFLKRFDLSSNFDEGSIINLREDEIWFLGDNAKQLDLLSPSSDVVSEHMPSTSSQTTRSQSQSRVLEHAKSPLIYMDSLRGITPDGSPPREIEDYKTIPSASLAIPNSRINDTEVLPVETSDEDNDELDLIGPSTFPAEGGQNSPRETSSTYAPNASPIYIKVDQLKPTSPAARSRSSSLGLLSNRHEAIVKNDTKIFVDQVVESPGNSVGNPLPEQPHSLDSEMTLPADTIVGSPPPVESDTTCTERSIQRDIISDIALDLKMNSVNDGMGPSADHSTAVAKEGAPPSAETPISAHVQIQLPPSIQEEILIPTPVVEEKEIFYNLDVDLIAGHGKAQPSVINGDNRHYFNPQYTIPSLDLLPAEFTRKVKSSKRKRDKAGEKDGKRDRDDTVPLGLNRWNAILTANPVWSRVSRASKCLSTREWGVAMTELRLIRTIQRIDQLKEEGRWSFRQPKKQRGVGGLIKSHWDYLLDEMKWMRTDFREERRWKIALAYNLSTAVLDWHLANTPEERQRTGICVKWQCSHFKSSRDTTPRSMIVESSEQEQPPQLLGVSYGSDDEDGQEQELRNVVDVLEPSAIIEDALVELATDIRPKNEEVDDRTAIELLRLGAEESGLSFENSPAEFAGGSEPGIRLKTTSNDPLLTGTKSSSQSTNGDAEAFDPPAADLKLVKTGLAPFREQIAHSEAHQLFVALNSSTSTDDTYQLLDSSDLSDMHLLFPELQPLGLLDVPAAAGPTDGKKKVEKRSDRDDPNKRAEDTTYTKLYPTGRFMYAKPTLIGPLQPSKRWKDGKWLSLEQTPITSDTEFNMRISEDNTSELFDGRSSTSNFAFQLHASSFKDKESKRESTHAWNAADDTLLRSLVDKYSTNWPLISECFNASRLSTLTDRRSAADCLYRWKDKWGSERKLPPIETTQSSGDAASLANSQMTTRGVKRIASSNISSPTTTSPAGNTETRKRRRHLLLQESIRKAGKKRVDTAQKALTNQRKPPQIHETHNQFNKLPRLSPAELSRMKADRDLRDTQDIALARKRQDDQIRQTLLLREQAQRGSTQGQVQQQQSQGQQNQAGQQTQPPAPSQQQQLAHQQLAQIQQLHQQVSQNTRQNISATGLPSRPARLSAATNSRQPGQQTQHLQQQRPLQIPMQVQAGASSNAPSNLIPQAQAPGNTFYGLPPNVTQEFLMAIQTAQQQQQGQSSLTNFGAQPQ